MPATGQSTEPLLLSGVVGCFRLAAAAATLHQSMQLQLQLSPRPQANPVRRNNGAGSTNTN
ncbi:hypothetical protein ZHAS_00011639 [Anopheles sinensis]|uniref:Uncharacterized protein n=1 Tax=Anopheles sinensis TaxID=74873 RepID=A0A084W0Q4_ANOSI|nr:hypothetical protein ZHAS_00011639 [Anopheles sinensis]